MGTIIIIPGLSGATKNPGFYGETKYAAGSISVGSLPKSLLLVGNKTSSGTITADGTPQQVFGVSEVETLAGAGSELATMAIGIDGTGGALSVPGINVYLGCVAEASATPAAATATITFATTATSTDTIYYRVCGLQVPFTVASGMTISQAATALAAQINSRSTLPVTAAAGGTGGAVVTLTAKNLGPRGNWFTLFQDKTTVGGMTSTIAGGTAMTGGGVRFTGGAGSDSPANLIAAIASAQFDLIAIACGDATLDAVHLALWKTWLNTAAGPTVGILEHLFFASTDTLTNCAALSRVTLNDARFFNLHHLNGETPASVIAATAAAQVLAILQVDPGAGTQYADMVLQGVAPQSQAADRPSSSVIETALGEGVTEIKTGADGTACITRLITTRCLNGSSPDYRCFDAADSFVPDYCREAAKMLWLTDFAINAPRVAPSVPAELKQPPAGVTTPQAWADALTLLARQFERGEGLQGPPILTDVDNHLPTAQWNDAGKFIVSAWPTKVMYGNFICGLSVRQV